MKCIYEILDKTFRGRKAGEYTVEHAYLFYGNFITLRFKNRYINGIPHTLVVERDLRDGHGDYPFIEVLRDDTWIQEDAKLSESDMEAIRGILDDIQRYDRKEQATAS